MMPVGTFTCLAGGRITPGEGSVQIDGDAELATAVLAAMAYTIRRGLRSLAARPEGCRVDTRRHRRAMISGQYHDPVPGDTARSAAVGDH